MFLKKAQMTGYNSLALLVLTTSISCQARATQTEDSARTPITGVWAFVSETNTETGELIRDDGTWSGIWVFTDGYHCLARMENNRTGLSRAEAEKLPLDEQVEYYKQRDRYSSTAGTYSVEGSTLRRQWQISHGPNIIGLESVANFSVKDDRFTVDLPRRSPDSGPAVRVVYRRLE